MKDKVLYTVKYIGFDKRDQRVLNATFLLSQTREVAFSAFVENKATKPSIIIIDFDDKKSIRRWQTLCIENAGYLSIPNIRITRSRPIDTENYYARRSCTANQLLCLLDTLVARELDVDAVSIHDSKQLLDTKEISIKTTKKAKEKTAARLLKSVLLIEVSVATRMQMHVALANYAQNIDLVSTGSNALKLTRKNCYDIIFLGTTLPDVDRYDIYRSIKKGKKSKDTPIIMLSSHLPVNNSTQVQLAEGDTHLIKPTKTALFKEIIARYT